MKNRGFTLIELLAVILILSLLTTLAVTSVTKMVRNSKEKLYTTQIKSIEVAAENWAADHLASLPEAGSCIYITVDDLQKYGVLDNDIKDPRTNKLIPTTTTVRIDATGGGNSLTSYTYKVTDDISDCAVVTLEQP